MNSPILLVGIPFLLSWALMFITGRPLIDWLKALKGMKWSPREDTPDSHLAKAGTPSMGGIGIVGCAFLVFVAFVSFTQLLSFSSAYFPGVDWADMSLLVSLPLIVVGHALLGLMDDWSKARGRGGLLARQKLVGQVVLSFLVSALPFIYISLVKAGATGGPSVFPPTFQNAPLLFVGVTLLIVVGTSNAVNLTDGIDGLAAGLSIQVAAAFTFLIYEFQWWGTLEYSTILIWLCLGGACLGFLAFNKHPAKVFMGDTGSLALGAALGAGAILTRTVWLLPFIGFIFYVEMFSVIFQVLYFKYTRKKYGEGKRLFRRAPLHHHFELSGWSERRVVATFWAVNLVTTIIGLVLWKMGVLPRFP